MNINNQRLKVQALNRGNFIGHRYDESHKIFTEEGKYKDSSRGYVMKTQRPLEGTTRTVAGGMS